MGRLSQAERDKLPRTAFAIPERREYPIQDRGHAQAALSEVAQHGSPKDVMRVRLAVAHRYPGMGSVDTKKKPAGKR